MEDLIPQKNQKRSKKYEDFNYSDDEEIILDQVNNDKEK